MPADEGETLLAYLAKPNPSTVIVALASKLDKRLKLFAQLSKKGFLHVLEAPRQLGAWVRDEAKAQGVKMDAAAVAAARRCGRQRPVAPRARRSSSSASTPATRR